MVHDARVAVDESNPGYFPDAKAKDSFYRNWIANYECSDCILKLRRDADQEQQHENENQDRIAPVTSSLHPLQQVYARTPHLLTRLAFLRANQFPELKTATPDERVRLLREEAALGGVPLEKNVDPTATTWLHGDASCFLELFDVQATSEAKQRFLRLFPAGQCACSKKEKEEEDDNEVDPTFAARKRLRDAAIGRTEGEAVTSVVESVFEAPRSLPQLPFVAMADLKGHFVTMIFFRDERKEEGDEISLISMVLVNSMDHVSASSPAVTGYFDLVCAMFAAKEMVMEQKS